MEAELRPLRADAARNRARVLDAAREAFAELGLDVGVEEIARRAGVGKGTLYRRFPTKDALVRAIFEGLLDEIDVLVAEAEAVPDPWDAFTRYVVATAELQISNQGFFDVVNQRLGAVVLSPDQRTRALAGTARLLSAPRTRAWCAGTSCPRTCRSCCGWSAPPPAPRSTARRCTSAGRAISALLLDGLRPEAATPLPAEAWKLTP